MEYLNKVFTIQEAAEKFGISKRILQNYCTGSKQKGYIYKPVFTEEECRQSGSTWLISLDGMKRVMDEYGKVRKGVKIKKE